MHHDLDIHPIPEKVLYIKNTPGSKREYSGVRPHKEKIRNKS